MGIVTKTGDDGTTALMYQRRVPKSHPRVEACGTIDELNAALGLARAAGSSAALQKTLRSVQKDLVVLMGELATVPEDLPRYTSQGFTLVSPAMTQTLEQTLAILERRTPPLRDWATPGGNSAAARLDFARAICRRAERRVCVLLESGDLSNPEIIPYLNRLSDLLWLMARSAEPGSKPRPRRKLRR